MTPKEFQIAARALATSIGPKAEIWLHMSSTRLWRGADHDGCLSASIYVDGMLVGETFSVLANDFETLLSRIDAKWTAYRDEHDQKLLRRMALKIIEITTDHGECTDAALRGADFTTDQVKLFGQRACDLANDMAGRGPFAVRMLGSSNGAPANEFAEDRPL